MGKYFEITYQGPFKGNNVSLPEDVIPSDYSPFLNNVILKNGEIRSRPRQRIDFLPSTPDRKPIQIITSFLDGNNVFHTVAVTTTGLWQLNRLWPKNKNKTWSLVGAYPLLPGSVIPANSSVFLNKFFWVNGGDNLWFWDGISSIGVPSQWQEESSYVQGTQILDSNGFLQVASNSGISGSVTPTWSMALGGSTTDSGTTAITWINNGKPAPSNGFSAAALVDAANGITAGAFFLIELNSQLIMVNTVESVGGQFTQRIRWSASGLPTVWDPNVNISAGFIDSLEVPDSYTGAFAVGTSAFLLRNNGITEMVPTGASGENPFEFNHLWASDRGIGNVLPFGYASYGPLGIFISEDDVYNVSLGGFKKIGGVARDAIFDDISAATGVAIGSIIPYYATNYIRNHYKLTIPQENDTVIWNYAIEEQSWERELKKNIIFTGIPRWSYIG